ncbi:RHS repeat-associated core domain-containing protein [Dyella mobilis]|uniref:RHS repeat-associated core domain-containing protein n=1 Tax=Dyella mobilis TaxID=1849582 RepID=A0ABS2KHP3_9GAMM|nr:RHS repeat-associated core domain-containing protein [Dyella mobilis]MBM7129878.1 RHS repeat-associated core domain-containing protein [Dyella mobilis]GLQ97856.1 hypothetical protein GCM10007863_22760 [Dyella mobilis]
MDGIPVANIDTANGSSTITYVTADELGTPRAIGDASGYTLWRNAYQGNPWNEQTPISSGYVYNLGLPGQYYDEETGLYNNVNRDYCPACGRYTESDPNGLFGDQLSTYAYADNDPLGESDPFGLASGQWQQVPGTNTWVRIDGPHVPGQQTHAHIQTKGGGGGNEFRWYA